MLRCTMRISVGGARLRRASLRALRARAPFGRCRAIARQGEVDRATSLVYRTRAPQLAPRKRSTNLQTRNRG